MFSSVDKYRLIHLGYDPSNLQKPVPAKKEVCPLNVVVGVHCDYSRELILATLANPKLSVANWNVSQIRSEEELADIKWDSIALQWDEFERVLWDRVLSNKMMSGNYCVRKGLIRKSQLAYNLSKYATKRPKSILNTAVPLTLRFEIDDPEYMDEALSDIHEVRDAPPGSIKWILKASMINQAGGIHVFDSVEQLTQIIEAEPDVREWVVQKYIDNPLLVDGRKFHLRVYVLAVGSLQVFMYDEVLALFAMNAYNNEDISDRASHITNTCVQRARADFDEEKTVRLLRELPSMSQQYDAGKQGRVLTDENVEHIMTQMKAILHDTFAALHSEPTIFLPLPHCFELFGIDFLVDDTLSVKLLEINASPDFAQTGERLRYVPKGVIEGSVVLGVNPQVQKRHPQAATNKVQVDDVKKKFHLCYDQESSTAALASSMSFF